jgi:hypothetical protein
MKNQKQHDSGKNNIKVKSLVFTLYYYLVQYNSCAWYVYGFFLLIEFMQMTHRTLESMTDFYESIGKKALYLATGFEYFEVIYLLVFRSADKCQILEICVYRWRIFIRIHYFREH